MMKKIVVISVTILVVIGAFWWGLSYITGMEQAHMDQFQQYIVNNPEQAVQMAFEKLKQRKEATVIADVSVGEKVMAFNLVGLSTQKINEKVLQLLSDYQSKSTFFVSGIDAAEETEFLNRVNEQGHSIGSTGLDGSGKLEMKTEEELINSFVRANGIIQKNIIQKKHELLYCSATDYTQKILQTAYASGYEKVVKSNYILNYRSFTSYEQTLNYIKKLPKGAIITVKMNGELSEEEYVKPMQDKKPAEDKKTGIELIERKELSEEERLINVIEWILKALQEEEYQVVLCEQLSRLHTDSMVNKVQELVREDIYFNQTEYVVQEDSSDKIYEEDENTIAQSNQEIIQQAKALRISNKGKLASTNGKIYTTQAAVNYSFYGVKEQVVLANILETLKIENIKATFFVSEKDLLENSEEIRTIVQAGHELQMMLIDVQKSDYLSVATSILKMQNIIKTQYRQVATYIRYPYDVRYTDEMLEAVSATGTEIIGQDIAIARSSIPKTSTSEEIIKVISNQGNKALKRGEIVYFRMDYYEDHQVLLEVMKYIKNEKVDNTGYLDRGKLMGSYKFATIKELAQGNEIYSYPVEEKNLLQNVKETIRIDNKIQYGLEELKKRYIGNQFVNSELSLPGFSSTEIEQLDTTGRFTDEPVIFLSFDDWGSDAAINQLLYVLKKHNVKATFFIRTNYIQHNPNLVRAIALEGHDIASHSDEHRVLANKGEEVGMFTEISDEEVSMLREDVVLSYEKLRAIIGDVQIDGRSVLTSYFRPPTLAVSKKGAEAIFEVGYQYIISGDFSTHDYEATSATQLIDDFIEGIETNGGNSVILQNGSNVVMHMSDEAKYTAEALDVVIPYYLRQGYSFARLSDYLK